MRPIIASIEGEYRRYRELGEDAMAQLGDAEFGRAAGPGGNSIAVIVQHLSGNFVSRFTDFLDSDGEKPWRERDREFLPRDESRAELMETWARGWTVLFDALAALEDADLNRSVTIRGVPHTVSEALHRSLAHASYHVGQIVYQAKARRGAEWSYLSQPPGGSAAYHRDPTREKPPPAVRSGGDS